MKYVIKELLRGPELLDDSRNIEIRECNTMDDAINLIKEMEGKGFELRTRKEKRDYDKIMMVELYFLRKPVVEKTSES